MARAAILPLPDEQARLIRTAADEIDARLGPNATGRAFAREFLPVVYEVTGAVLGAHTVGQLLRQMTGRSPAKAALQEEVAAFKKGLTFAGARPEDLGSTPAAHRDLLARPAPTAATVAADLGRLQAMQLDYLREQLAMRERQAAVAETAREAAVIEATAAVAKLEGLNESLGHLQAECARLTEVLALEQERARAENRQNLMRVESVRAETRAAEEQHRLALQRIAQLQGDLAAVKTERDALAQRNAALLKAAARA